MDIAIREAVPGDIDALKTFHDLFMEHHARCDDRFALRSGEPDRWRERICAAVEDAETLVLVAEESGQYVGCAYTLIKPGGPDFGPEKIGYLCDVFVVPEYRRHGLARRFLSLSQDWLRRRGIHTIEASWAVGCLEARGTWPGLGFVPMSVSGRLEF